MKSMWILIIFLVISLLINSIWLWRGKIRPWLLDFEDRRIKKKARWGIYYLSKSDVFFRRVIDTVLDRLMIEIEEEETHAMEGHPEEVKIKPSKLILLLRGRLMKDQKLEKSVEEGEDKE